MCRNKLRSKIEPVVLVMPSEQNEREMNSILILSFFLFFGVKCMQATGDVLKRCVTKNYLIF